MTGRWLWLCPVLLSTAATSPVANTTLGSVRGIWATRGVAAFLAIPFAQPPTDHLRFKSPAAPQAWSGIRNGTQYPPPCIGDFYGYPDGRSEDCLYLNIFTPTVRIVWARSDANSPFEVTPKEPLPVLFYIHGGCYDYGATRNYPVDGIATNLASRGLVVVTVQYRLEIFGFFTSKSAEFPSNLGIQDQVAALRWVSNEIGAFGGDASRVTVSGESAGAASSAILTYAPAARGSAYPLLFPLVHLPLFRPLPPGHHAERERLRRRRESGRGESGGGAGVALPDERGRLGRGSHFPGLLRLLSESQRRPTAETSHGFGGCSLPTHERRRTQTPKIGGCVWGPVTDPGGSILPDWPRNLAKDRLGDMPIIIGNTRDEMFEIVLGEVGGDMSAVSGISFLNYAEKYILPQFPEEFRPQILSVIRDQNDFGSLIHLNSAPAWYKAIVQMSSDFRFFASTLEEIQMAALTTKNIFVYSFDYVSDGFKWPPENKGVWHSMDLAFLFNQSSNSEKYSDPVFTQWAFTANDLTVADHFGRYWANFVKTGKPNQPDAPSEAWLPFSEPKAPRFLSLGLRPAMSSATFHPNTQFLYRELIPSLVSIGLDSVGGSTTYPDVEVAPVTMKSSSSSLPLLRLDSPQLWLICSAGALSIAALIYLVCLCMYMCFACTK